MERNLKKMFIRLTPGFIKRVLIKRKYLKYNKHVHQNNIANGKVIKISCKNEEKYSFLKSVLKKSFSGFLNIDGYKVYFHPIAVIKVPKTIDAYLKEIGAKSRNMNVKAQRNGIVSKIFDWNKYLDDIYEINTSSIKRQGRAMDKAYMQYPKKVNNLIEDDFKIEFIGAFVEEKLVGYIELYIYGNFAMTNRILGHKDYLKFGVMNLMVKKCVEYGIENNIEYINYLTMQNRKNNSLSAFKKRVGFREYSLLELK